ncbi:hypothetical protein D3C81_1253610 [compost metagenome]
MHARIADIGQFDFPGIAPQFQQLLRHFNHRQHEVDHARIDGSLRHAVELGVRRCLGHGDAALFLDARQTDRAIRAGARQHQAECALTVYIGQIAEKQIDRRVTCAWVRVGGGDLKQTVIHFQQLCWRNDVDPVFFDRHRTADLQHRHFGRFLDDLVGDTLVVGRQVKNDHERHAVVLRHVFKEPLDRLQPARRRTDPHHRKVQRAWAQGLSLGNSIGGCAHGVVLRRFGAVRLNPGEARADR